MKSTNLPALLLLPMLAHKLTALAGNERQVRSGILDRNDWLWLE